MNLKISRFFKLIVFFVSFALYAKAQEPNNQYFIPLDMPKSPNSTQFAKYGDYPVNLYSGLPDISIPLYTVESGNLSVPVTLSYHASGLMVNEAASWVGAGWSLNAGGGITRKVEGTPDEGGYLNGWKDATKLNPSISDDDLAYLWYGISQKSTSTYDTRPDIYSYNLPGHSGKFFFDSNEGYKIETIPYAPIAIKDVATPFGTATPIFDITDEHGNIYVAGKTATELTANSNDGGSHNQAVTGFMLETMISQNRRDTINFSYQQQHITSPYQTGQLINVEDMQSSLVPGNGCPISYAGTINPPQAAGSQSNVYEQDISQINFKNGKITFSLSSNGRIDLLNTAFPLRTMSVYTYNFSTKLYELQKQVVFYTSYYNTVQNQTGRLRLDSIQVLDKAGAITQHYRFEYNQQAVPAYTSFSKDYWGYYNGKVDNVSNPTLIPQTQISYQQINDTQHQPTQINIGSNDPTSRDPDSTKMQAGVLTGIYYPTGGHTTFAYQTNRFFDSNNAMHLTGGLRVASISSYDGISNTPIVKTYQYNNAVQNYFTNGLAEVMNYNFFIHTATARYFRTPAPGGNYYPCITKQVRTFYSEPTLSLTPTEGNPVAYTNVTEYIGTPGTNIGKTVYTFRYKADQWDGSVYSTGVPVVEDFFYARGQLTSKADFKFVSPSVYQVVKRVVNTYTAFPQRLYDTVGMVVGQAKITDGTGIVYPDEAGTPDNSVFDYPFDNYVIASDDNYITSSTTYNFDSSDTTKYTKSVVNYNYDDAVHQQVNSVSQIDSKGNTRTENNLFAYNLIPTGQTQTGNAVLDTMLNRNMFAVPIEKSETYTTSAGAKTTSAELHQFKFGTISNSIVDASVSKLNIPAPVTDFAHAGLVSGNLVYDNRYVQMISLDNYDNNNNIIQYTTRNANPVSILWDYLGQYPVAQVKNATNNVTNFRVAYTSFETPPSINWSYAGTPVFDETAPTGNMSYPLSGGAVSLTGFDGSQSYTFTLWGNSGSAPTVSAGLFLTGTPIRTMNGWTLYQYTVQPAAGNVTVSGSGSVDELRLYPVGSQMISYDFDPSGLRWMTDAKGEVAKFEYDPFQRLKNIKDFNGNIVKNYGYHTYDQIVPNDAIGPQTFTRDNCPVGSSPQSTTYSVAAGKYYSSTKASANAEATYDLNTNGHLLADNPAICGCPLPTVQFNIINHTSISTFTVNFTGTTNYSVPVAANTTTPIFVQQGVYSVSISPVDGNNHTFILGSRSPATVAPGCSFTSVSITASNNESPLSIQ